MATKRAEGIKLAALKPKPPAGSSTVEAKPGSSTTEAAADASS